MWKLHLSQLYINRNDADAAIPFGWINDNPHGAKGNHELELHLDPLKGFLEMLGGTAEGGLLP